MSLEHELKSSEARLWKLIAERTRPGVDAAKIAAQSVKSDIAARLRRARIAAIEALG